MSAYGVSDKHHWLVNSEVTRIVRSFSSLCFSIRELPTNSESNFIKCCSERRNEEMKQKHLLLHKKKLKQLI